MQLELVFRRAVLVVEEVEKADPTCGNVVANLDEPAQSYACVRETMSRTRFRLSPRRSQVIARCSSRPPPAPERHTSQPRGHPRTIFKRAIERGNLIVADMTIREIGRVTLVEALELTALVAVKDPRRLDRFAVRWLERYLAEIRLATRRSRSAAFQRSAGRVTRRRSQRFERWPTRASGSESQPREQR
jgi:hypothetical protein